MGVLERIASGADLRAVESRLASQPIIIVDATDWRIIPAENLVAACQACAWAWGTYTMVRFCLRLTRHPLFGIT